MKTSPIALVAATLPLFMGCAADATPEDAPAETKTAQKEDMVEPEDTVEAKDPVDAESSSDSTFASVDSVESLRAAIAKFEKQKEHTAGRVQVQHILISFTGANSRVAAKLPRAEAEALVADLVQQIHNGADFDALVKKHTEDSHPGIYGMSARGGGGDYPRSGMAAAFGDVGWRLEVGEVGVAGFDPGASPFGWHIIKRLE